MSQKVSDSNILTGEPLISSTPPLILLQSEEDLTSDLSPSQPCENPCAGDSVSDATSLTSKTEESGISTTSARSCDPAPCADSCKVANSGTASSSLHDESWNIEGLLTEDKNPFSTLTEEHLSRLEDVLSSEEVRSFLQQTQLQELNSGLSDSPVVGTSTGGTSAQASAAREPLELDVFQNQAAASCSLQIDDALANQDGVREQELAAMAAAFIDHAYALPYADAFTDSTASSPRKSARIKQRADDGKSAYDSDFEYYLTSTRRRKKEETFEEEGTQTESSQTSVARSPSTGTPQPKRRSTRIVDMENREKAEKILQENRLKEQEAKEAMMKSAEKGSETPEEGKGDARVGRKPKKKRGRPPKAKVKLEQEEEEEEDKCDAEDSETQKGGRQETPEKPVVKGRRGRRPAGTMSSPPLSPASGVDADVGGEGTKEQKPAVGKPGRKKKVLLQVKEAEPEQASQLAEDKTTQSSAHVASKGDMPEKPMNTELIVSESQPAAPEDAGVKDGEIEGAAASENKSSSLTKGPSKPTSHWKKGGMKIRAVGGKALPANEKRGLKAQAGALKMEESSEEDDLPLKALAKSPKKEAQPGEKGEGEASHMGVKKKKMVKQQKGVVAGHRKVSGGENPTLSEDKKKAGSKPMGAAKTGRQALDGKELQSSEVRDKKVTLSGEVKKDGDHKASEKADGKPRTIKIGEKGDDSHGAKQLKHKHRKSEEIIIDPTVTDLFKPDGIIPTDPVKKEETEAADGKGQHHGSALVKVGPTGDGNVQAAQPDRPADVTVKEEKQGLVKGNNHSNEISTDKNHSSSVRKMSASSVEPPEKAVDVDIRPCPELVKASHSGSQDTALESSEKNAESAKSMSKSPSGEKNAESVKSIAKTSSEKSSKSVKGVPKSASSEGNSESTKSFSKSKSTSSERNSISSKSGSSERLSEIAKSVSKSAFSERNSESSEGVLKSASKIVKEHSSDLKSQDHKKSAKSTELKHPGRGSVEDAGHESGDLSYEDDENDSDWEPAHDPHTLYCVCRKPHGNKFMICCDKCQEWYHGHCVGVSRAQGHRMEQENKEYICPVCTGTVVRETKGNGDTEKKGVAPSLPTAGQEGSRKSGQNKEERKLEKRPSSSSKDISSKSPKDKKEKWKPQRCVASECRRDARLGSVYCSTACIVRHAQDSLRLLHKNTQQESAPKEKDTDRRSSIEDSHVKVLERRSGRVLSGSQAPTEAQLEMWLETHPTFEVLQPSSFYKKKDKARKHKSSHGQTAVKKLEEKKEVDSGTSRSAKQDDGPDLVRLNVRKTLRDALVTRAEEADDIVLSSSEIKHLALAIEEELFKVYGSTGHKYRAKYRTLLFNLKDQKNKGLYRKVLTGKIKPSHLVKMTTEELASRELAKWREMETKHTLERIEQTEKEAMKEGQHHIRKKTHKGEVEVEDEDMSTLVSRVEEQKTKPESKEEETAPSTVVDTTDQHRAHLFDLNCKICTGKILPPVVEEPAAKKLTHTLNEEEEEDKPGAAKVGREEREPQQEAAAITAHHSHSSDGEVSVPVVTHRPASLSHVTVGSPDSALQSGLESKPKFTPSGPMLWKGFISMQDFAKFFTSAYKVSGPVENLALPDTVQICGRISPDQMWDYLGKIRQAGSRDICILRFIPGSDDEKVAYVHLYSYLNSRGRCGVVGNVPKDIKDLYLVPLASHSKIPQVLLPFDGPGLESNRPHMLVGIVVRQKAKRPSDWQPPSKTAPTSTGSHSSPSQSKKMRLSAKDTEAYSPTAEGGDTSGHEPLYIPTPTVVIQRSNTSATSSSSSTPSSSDRTSSISSATAPSATATSLPHRRGSKVHVTASGKERRHGAGTNNGAEPYSPSGVVAADAPYDPEDESQFVEVEVSSSIDDGAIPAASSTGPLAPSVEGSGKVKAVSGDQCGVSTTNQPPSSSVNVDSIVQKISTSTSPQEISALMVTALASAKNSAEQQQLLTLLASRVQQQKKINAENKLKDKQSQPGDMKDVPASEISASVSDSESQPAFSSSLNIVQSNAAVIAPSTSCGAAATSSSNNTSRVTLVGQQSTNPVQPISRISSLTPDTENMPLALKALMEDLKGNMQMSKAVDKRTERDRRDLEKKESSQLSKDTPAKGVEDVSSAAEQTGSKTNAEETESKTEPVIPGLGGVEDEGKERKNMAADEKSVASNSIFEVVASSRLVECEAVPRTGPADGGDQLTTLELDVSAALALADIDLRQITLPVLDSKFSASAEQATKSDEAILSLQDQDDRFPPKTGYAGLPSSASAAAPILHPALPPTFAGPHRMPSSCGPSLQSLHSQHPVDIHDVDHRRHPHAAGPFAGVAVGPPLFSSRASSQPPPPGTEMEDAAGRFAVSTIGDVDMRQQPPKRSAALLPAPDQSAEKMARHDAVVQKPPPLPPLPPQPPPPPPPPPTTSLASSAPDSEAGRIPSDFGDRSGAMAFRPDPTRHGTADHPGGGVHREGQGQGEGSRRVYHPRLRQHSGEPRPRYSPMQSQQHYRSSPHHRYGHHGTAGNRHSKNGHGNRGRP